jgi:hypothetical protein
MPSVAGRTLSPLGTERVIPRACPPLIRMRADKSARSRWQMRNHLHTAFASTMPARTPFPVSDHCDGRRFFNPRGHVNRTWLEVLKWRLTSRPSRWPHSVVLPPPGPPPLPGPGKIVATWINHASYLLQSAAGNVLIDPVYSERASPFCLGRTAARASPGATLR